MKRAVGLNFSWVTFSTLLALAVCFKKFEIAIKGESIWAVVGLVVLFCISGFEAYRTGFLGYTLVFPFLCFTLFARFVSLVNNEGNTNKALMFLHNYLYMYLNI